MRHAKKSLLLALIVVFALLAAACGDSDDAADDAAPETTATETTAAGDSSSETTAAPDTSTETTAAEDPADEGLEGTLRVLIHQNPAGVEFFESFNDDFEAANPGVSIDMSVVNANDLATVNQTRLTANDIDVMTLTVTGFDKAVQPYMTGAEPPFWQQLIEAGLLMDLTDQPFMANYDQAAIDSGSYDGRAYAVSLGRTTYSGMFVNLDILEQAGVAVPTTFAELQPACDAVIDAGFKCMIAGGQDGWPVFVGSYGLLGALYPDQEGLVEGLWTGELAWNDERGLELFNKYAAYADMLDPESAGLGGDAAAARYAVGDIAFGPMGGWNAATIEDGPFEWTYIPFPGSDVASENQTLFGKIDMSMAVAANTPVPDIAMAYLAALSDTDTYNSFANAVNYVPTQPTAVLENTLGQSIAPILQAGNFTIGFEQVWVAPAGAGQWAEAHMGSLWLYNGDFNDPVEAANQAQADLEAGL